MQWVWLGLLFLDTLSSPAEAASLGDSPRDVKIQCSMALGSSTVLKKQSSPPHYNLTLSQILCRKSTRGGAGWLSQGGRKFLFAAFRSNLEDWSFTSNRCINLSSRYIRSDREETPKHPAMDIFERLKRVREEHSFVKSMT